MGRGGREQAEGRTGSAGHGREAWSAAATQHCCARKVSVQEQPRRTAEPPGSMARAGAGRPSASLQGRVASQKHGANIVPSGHSTSGKSPGVCEKVIALSDQGLPVNCRLRRGSPRRTHGQEAPDGGVPVRDSCALSSYLNSLSRVLKFFLIFSKFSSSIVNVVILL